MSSSPAQSMRGSPEPGARSAPVPLSSLGSGCRATVHQRVMSDDESELLAAMGLVDRCPLRVCRAGEPCFVQVATTRLALSRAMARQVLVLPTDGTDATSGPSR